ncbi:MAG: nitroreductase/quinone reductase family protein [Thermomicrobiales bacterium]
MRTFLNHVANPVVRALLRSPLHALLSRSVMLITVIGRRSGRSYTLPVQYARQGDAVYVYSPGDRRWWRNLDEGEPVTARIDNESLTGVGEILRGPAAAAARAALEETSLAKAANRFPDGVVVRVRLDHPGQS